MKHYYIGRRLGTGTDDDPFYSELRRYIQTNHPSEPHFTKQKVVPMCPWSLMCYDLSDTAHADVIANVPQIFSFPSGALSTPVSDIPTAKRTAMRDKLEGIGLEFTWATGATTVREILEYIAHTFDLANWCKIQISAQNFDIHTTVGSIPVDKMNRLEGVLNNLGIDTTGFTGSTTIKEVVQAVRSNTVHLFRDDE